jgi:hypothetical protein
MIKKIGLLVIILCLTAFVRLSYADGNPCGFALDEKHFVVVCDIGKYRQFNQIIYLYETDGKKMLIKDAVFVSQEPEGTTVTENTKISLQKLNVDNIQSKSKE